MSSPPVARLLPPDPALPPLDQLRDVVTKLRGPGGCPWDREQTHESLRGGLLEEAYEVVAAIDSADEANLREELGDLLLQVVFHSQLGAEQGRFTLDDVARGITEKLVRRHPHVFAGDNLPDSAAVLVRWDEIKRAEKGTSSSPPSALDGLPAGLPALLHAQKLQKKASNVGFDWPEAAPVLAKIHEEVAELVDAVTVGDPTEIEDELGDLLFSVVNLARQVGVESEVALAGASRKFTRRFQDMERIAHERGQSLSALSLAELDRLWEEVKQGLAPPT